MPLHARPHYTRMQRQSGLLALTVMYPQVVQCGILFMNDFGYQCVQLQHALPYQHPSIEK